VIKAEFSASLLQSVSHDPPEITLYCKNTTTTTILVYLKNVS